MGGRASDILKDVLFRYGPLLKHANRLLDHLLHSAYIGHSLVKRIGLSLENMLDEPRVAIPVLVGKCDCHDNIDTLGMPISHFLPEIEMSGGESYEIKFYTSKFPAPAEGFKKG